jgi:hypothetical protein
MTIKELIKILKNFDQNATIDMACDEEGNAFGDIDTDLAEGKLKNGGKVYSLYPVTSELPEDRYEMPENTYA